MNGRPRKPTKRQRLITELASIQRLQGERPSWFRPEDYRRLAHDFATKSAELVELELRSYRKKYQI